MATRRIIIQLGFKKKLFIIKASKYDELVSLIEYYGYDYCLRDDIFVFSNPITFNIVDLSLSFVSTPQPPLDEGLIA